MAVRTHGALYSLRVNMASWLRRAARRVEPERDPAVEKLDNAPPDDEPVTDDELRAIEQARRDFREGRSVSLEELKRRLG